MIKDISVVVVVSTIINLSISYSFLDGKQVVNPDQEYRSAANTQVLATVSTPITEVSNIHRSDSYNQNTLGASRRELALLDARFDKIEKSLQQILENEKDNQERNDIEISKEAALSLKQGNAAVEKGDIESTETLDQLNNKLVSEVVDTKWATQVEGVMYAAIQKSNLSGSQINSIDCRSSLCKTEIIHDNAVDALEFQLEFLSSLSGTLDSGSLQQYENLDGSLQSVLYFNRNSSE